MKRPGLGPKMGKPLDPKTLSLPLQTALLELRKGHRWPAVSKASLRSKTRRYLPATTLHALQRRGWAAQVVDAFALTDDGRAVADDLYERYQQAIALERRRDLLKALGAFEASLWSLKAAASDTSKRVIRHDAEQIDLRITAMLASVGIFITKDKP